MSDASETGMKRVFLLYNPKSGRETIKSSLSDIVEIFTRAGYEVTARPTLMRGDASSVAETVQDSYDILVCCGGDGTLNETVAGCLRRKNAITIGYIPCGSTNDFGNTIYGPIDKLQATTCILKKQIHMTDCGMLENTPFVYTAAFGLFTDISYETPHSAKATLGHAAYLLEAVKNLGNIKVHKVKAVIDNSETIEGEFLIGMVTNAAYVGGFQNITGKDVSLQDGELELTMLGRPEKPSEYGKVLQALLEGSQNEFVIRRKIKKIHFDFDEPTSFTVDGEYGGTYQTAEIKCMPSAFPLIY